MTRKKKILISGAGVAGISAAVLLDKEKYDVELIEQSSSFRNIGFSIVLWKSGYRVLSAIAKHAGHALHEGKDCYRVDGFQIFAGDTLARLKRFTTPGYAHTFERDRLMHILEDSLRVSAPSVRVSFSRSIRHIEYESGAERAIVTFRDGSQRLYDAVIIAEGVHSPSRELIAVGEDVRAIPYALRYAWFRSPTVLGNYAAAFFSAGHMAVIHPPPFRNLLGFYFDKGASKESQEDFIRTMEKRIRQPSGEYSEIDRMTSDVFELKEVHLDAFCAQRAAVIGDAAHGRPPTLGFGTSLALEDAATVARELNAVHDAAEIPQALKKYSDARMPRVKDVYRLQSEVQEFYTKNRFKVALIEFFFKIFYGSILQGRMIKLASFKA